MTGVLASSALSRIRLNVDGPSRPGIMTSMRIRSGRISYAKSIPIWPEAAVRTSRPASRLSVVCTTTQISGSSSTYRTDRSFWVTMIRPWNGRLSGSRARRAHTCSRRSRGCAHPPCSRKDLHRQAPRVPGWSRHFCGYFLRSPNTDADGEADGARRGIDGGIRDGLADLFCADSRLGRFGTLENNGKLIPAQARAPVRLAPQAFGDLFGEFPQHDIADGMSVCVVDPFEMIDVE